MFGNQSGMSVFTRECWETNQECLFSAFRSNHQKIVLWKKVIEKLEIIFKSWLRSGVRGGGGGRGRGWGEVYVLGKCGQMYCGQENCNFQQVSFDVLVKFELDVIIFRENS